PQAAAQHPARLRHADRGGDRAHGLQARADPVRGQRRADRGQAHRRPEVDPRRHRQVPVIKTVVLVLIAGLFGGTGHLLLSKGMTRAGHLPEPPSGLLGRRSARGVSTPWLILGAVFQARFFFMYLTLLPRDDASKILPMPAFAYTVVATLAYFFRAEPVTPA